jgi:TfoX/Sxy family transcriptional regulator of competence genes
VTDADELFEQLATRFADDTAVTLPAPGRGKFGASALKVDGKIFAMVLSGELVVKLPRARVEELVATGAGTPFDAGRGRPMKEWVSIAPERADEWPPLADEARRFVSPP